MKIPLEEIDYFHERVMRYVSGDREEFAIHDVYFAADGRVVTHTVAAMSPRAESIAELREMLLGFLKQEADEFVCGDLGHTYDRKDIKTWLEATDHPFFEYNAEDDDVAADG